MLKLNDTFYTHELPNHQIEKLMDDVDELANVLSSNGQHTFEEKLVPVMQGVTAEIGMMHYFGFERCDLKYTDLIDSEGRIIEIKTRRDGTLNRREWYDLACKEAERVFVKERATEHRHFDFLFMFRVNANFEYRLMSVIDRDLNVIDNKRIQELWK